MDGVDQFEAHHTSTNAALVGLAGSNIGGTDVECQQGMHYMNSPRVGQGTGQTLRRLPSACMPPLR